MELMGSMDFSTRNSNNFSYGTDLLNLLGYSMLGKIKSNIAQDKSMFENILPEKDFWKHANFQANYSPSPGYNLGLEINPRFMDISSPNYDPQIGVSQAIESFYTGDPISYTDVNPVDIKITGSIPFDIEGL